MQTITIPKELEKNRNLVAVPRTTYAEFLAWQRKVKLRNTFKPTVAEKKALARARKNFARGKFISFEKLRDGLGAHR